jgi:hypothetical protein
MTIEEKRKELESECEMYKDCEKCPHTAKGWCAKYAFGASPEIIEKWYASFFEGGEPYIEKNEEPRIKDSGNRREFTTGAVRDIQEGKGRMDLLPWAAIMEVSKHCENGAKKYGEHNVDKGLPVSSFCDSAARHLAKYIDGWDDEPHLLAAAWNLLWAIQMELKHPELCDVPWKGEQK